MRPFLVVLLTVLGVASVLPGCGSDSSSSTNNPFNGKDAGKDSGTCNVMFCPTTGTGTPCCAGNRCGTDTGNGCVASPVVYGGQ